MKNFSHYFHNFTHQLLSQKEIILKKQLAILIFSLLLSAVLSLGLQKESHIQSGYTLKREGIGGSEYSLPLKVQGLNPKKKESICVTISPRIYTKEEADRIFSEFHEKIEALILPPEESFDDIRTSLHLNNYFPEENIKMSWNFCPTALINGEEKITEEKDSDFIMNYRPILED